MNQHIGLEARHLAGRSRPPVGSASAYHVTHHRINAQSLRVVDIFVPGQTAVDRLAQQRRHAVLNVAAGAEVEQL